MDDDQRSDEELARQAGGGDEAAFAELYRRYFPGVYDFALRLTRDREQAALVTQVSFLRAHQAPRSGDPQAPFKIQLFAVAHRDVAERLRRLPRPVLEGEEAFAVADPARLADPVLAAELPDLAHMAWQATREMKLDQYELLDLSGRQRLDVGETAAVLRTRPEAVERKLARLGDAFEKLFTSLVLLSRGRRECLDLDFLVGDDRWSSALRRRILHHVQGCQVCQGTRRRYPSGIEVLAALAPAPAPAGWQEAILERLLQAARAGTTAAEPAPVAPAVTPVATPPPPRRPAGPFAAPVGGGQGIGGWFGRLFGGGGARGPLLAVLGGGLLVVIVILAALCGAGAFDGGEAAPTSTASPTPTATASATPTLTATPTATETSIPPPPATSTPVPTATPLPATAPPPPTSTPAAPTAPPPMPTPTPLVATPTAVLTPP